MKKNIIILLISLIFTGVQIFAQQPDSLNDSLLQQQTNIQAAPMEETAQQTAAGMPENAVSRYGEQIEVRNDFSHLMNLLNIFLVVMGIGVPIAIFVIGYWLNKKTNKTLDEVEKKLRDLKISTKEQMGFIKQEAQLRVTEIKLDVEKMLQETEKARAKVESEKCAIEKLSHEATAQKETISAIMAWFESKKEEIALSLEKSPDETDENKEKINDRDVEELVKLTEKTKTQEQYTAYDWFLIGYDADRKNDYEKAIEHYKKAIEKDPRYIEAYLNLGAVLSDMGQENGDKELFQEAIDNYKKALTINPEYAIAYSNWASDLSLLGDMAGDEALYNESIEKFKKAVELKADFKDAYFNWGCTLLNLAEMRGTLNEDEPEIAAKFLKAYELGETNAAYNMACLYSLMDEKDKALEWLETTLKETKYARDVIRTDRDFADLINDERFTELLDKYRPRKEIKEQE